jgi:hypothetical protein
MIHKRERDSQCSKGDLNADLDGVVVLGSAVAANLFEVAQLSLAADGARGHFNPE